MLNPKEEAQSIKRVETISLQDTNSIKTCDNLIEICIEIAEKININISDFIVENKIFGYNHSFEIRKSISEILYLKEKLVQKRKVTNDLECLMDYIIGYNREKVLSDIIELTGVYYMYLGNFAKGLSMINFSKEIGGEDSHSIVTNIEVLNEFIFKYNLSIDITRLDNYKEAVGILQGYYDKNFRLDRGDQLLIILYDNLNQVRKSRRILESIYNVSNNALFHYEIGKGKKGNRNKVNIIIGLTLIICLSGGIIYTKMLGEKANKVSNISQVKKDTVKEVEKVEPKTEPKAEVKTEPKTEPKVEKAVDISTLKTMIEGANNKSTIDNIDKQLVLIEADEKVKSSSEYKQIKKQFINKKQSFYYKLGRESYKNGKYDNAIEDFTLAYNVRIGEYLDPHITYYLASAVKKTNSKDSLVYYKEYIKNYSKDDASYIEEAIYNVSIINLEIKNTSEAKKYARMLVDKYPKSMYNNEKIKEILS